MIKIDIDKSTLEKLLEYHANYTKGTISENWRQIVGKKVKGKVVEQKELDDIEHKLDSILLKQRQVKDKNLFLKNIVEICTTQYLRDYAITSDKLFSQNKERYVNILLEIIGYRNFNVGDNAEKYNKGIVWNRHNFVNSLNVRVCPYCNRQYITSFYKRRRSVTTADVDHYYPKTQYPLLSMNFFNLVPSCSICNSKSKGKKTIGVEDITLNPFFDDSDSLFFRVNDDELGELYKFRNSITKISIEVNKNKDDENQKRAKNSVKIFYLPELYNVHVKEADSIRQNLNHFTKENFENIFQKNYKDLFDNYEDFKKLIFYFNYLADDDEPLVKFKKDIYNQLNFHLPKDE